MAIIYINNDFGCLHERSSQIKGTSQSSSISMMKKSTGNMNLSSMTKTYSTTLYIYFINLSTNYSVILDGLTSQSPIRLNIDRTLN